MAPGMTASNTTAADIATIHAVWRYTVTSPERVCALIRWSGLAGPAPESVTGRDGGPIAWAKHGAATGRGPRLSERRGWWWRDDR